MSSHVLKHPEDPDNKSEIARELIQYQPRRIQRYAHVNVLLLTWKDGDDAFATEAVELAQMFREHFNYTVRPYEIPSTDSQVMLNLHVARFIESFGGDGSLIIVYYGGHGGRPEQTESAYVWAALFCGGPELDWSIIQPQLLGAGCDVVILLDCCFAGQAARARISHTVEFLAAADKDHWTPKGDRGRPSFTRVLMREMTSMLLEVGVVTLPSLHKQMLHLKAGLVRQPIYVSMTTENLPIPVRLTRWTPAGTQAGLKWRPLDVGPSKKHPLIDLRLRLLRPLDAPTTTSLVKWMTKGSPPVFYDIELIDQVLSETRAIDSIASQLVMPDTSEPTGSATLPSKAAEEALARLKSLKDAIFEPSMAELGDIQALQKFGEIRTKTEEVVSLVADCLTSIDSQSLQRLQSMDLMNIKDLKAKVSMRLTLLNDADHQNQVRVIFEEQAQVGQRLRRGKRNSTGVIVEYTYGDETDSAALERMSKQVSRIAALHMEPKISAFHTLQGLGFLRETLYGPRCGFIYEEPNDRQGQPFSLLSDVILARKLMPLDQRYRLALALCEGILHLHSIGWVHKAIRSSNVLIFSQSEAEDSQSPNQRYDLGNPYFIGFDYSRPGDAETWSATDFDLSNNLYRHPERWGKPLRFETYHEIYALGILLAEIGLWKLLPKMDSKQDSFQAVKKPERLRDFLLGTVHERLEHATGCSYALAVQFCLERTDWRAFEDWQLQREVRDKIWRPLTRLCPPQGEASIS